MNLRCIILLVSFITISTVLLKCIYRNPDNLALRHNSQGTTKTYYNLEKTKKIISLPETPIYYLTTDFQGKRAQHIQRIFKNYRLTGFLPQLGIHPRKSGATGFTRILQYGLSTQSDAENFQPFIMLEDDVSIFREWPQTLSYPADCDFLYIGLSKWGLQPEQDDDEYGVYFDKVAYQGSIDEDIVKVYNMLSSHGVMVCSPQAVNILLRCMNVGYNTGKVWDIFTAMIQPYYNVYALTVPLVYQDKDYQGNETSSKILFHPENNKEGLFVNQIFQERLQTYPCLQYAVEHGTNPSRHQHMELNKMVEKYSLVPTQNIFVDHSLLWCRKDNDFCHRNWPNKFTHDLNIKQHLLTHSLQLPRNYGIIDCGAHIGDGAIPIAHALIQKGRGDIIVYAIDPSPGKCEYIKAIAKINRLTNLRIIQCGLSDQDNQVYSHAVDENWLKSNNSGGTRWHNVQEEKLIAQNREKITFMKLDTLVSEGIIRHPIGYIHFDVENMEPQAIRGGLTLFSRDKPILSAETHTEPQKIAILDLLEPLGYQFVEKIQNNSIFMPTKE